MKSEFSSLSDTLYYDLQRAYMKRDIVIVMSASLLYVFTGCVYFGYSEDMHFLDALYFSIVTLSTVGYGDLHPITKDQKMFTCFFVLSGMLLTGSAVTLFFEHLLVFWKKKAVKRNRRLSALISKPQLSVNMKNTTASNSPLSANNSAEHNMMFPASRLQKKDGSLREFLNCDESVEPIDPYVFMPRDSQLVNREIVETNRISSEQGASGALSRRRQSTLQRISAVLLGSSEEPEKKEITLEQFTNLSRKNINNEISDMRRTIVRDVIMIILILFIGTVSMMSIEDWDWEDALYFSCSTVATVGYGDLHPNTDSGKVFTIFYILLGIVGFTLCITNIAKFPIISRNMHNEQLVVERFGMSMNEDTMSEIINNGFFTRMPMLRANSESLGRTEFMLLVLHMMGKLEEKDILLASKVFDKLDSAGCGVLGSAMLQEELQKAKIRGENQRMAESAERQRDRGSFSAIANVFSNTFHGTWKAIGSFSSVFRYRLVHSDGSRMR